MLEGRPPNWHLKPFQLIIKIPNDPPPTFKKPEEVSQQFKDFVTLCLQKDAEKRPTAQSLLEVINVDCVFVMVLYGRHFLVFILSENKIEKLFF